MDREALFALLSLAGLGALVIATGPFFIPRVDRRPSERTPTERDAWRMVCAPGVPILLITCGLIGWAFVEPESAESVPATAIVLALWGAILLTRAALRSVLAILRARGVTGIATVGLIRPRIVVSPDLAVQLAPAQLEAAMAHEHTHCRHRDPLRVLVAQFVTDLSWPWPAGQKRLDRWMFDLECARDDEAVRAGVDGTDLAAAIIRVVKDTAGRPSAPVSLTGSGAALKLRIERLLRPPAPEVRPTHQGMLALLLAAAGFGWLGLSTGEPVVAWLLRILP